MLGFRLQILGQYQGLLRNFWERSQSVSPLTIVYSSGVPGTGWMFPSGGGRGLCSVMGAFSGRCTGGLGFAAGRGLGCGSMACGGTGGGGGSCCARTGSARARASAPPHPALLHRAIVRVRIAALLTIPAGAAASAPIPAPADAPRSAG